MSTCAIRDIKGHLDLFLKSPYRNAFPEDFTEQTSKGPLTSLSGAPERVGTILPRALLLSAHARRVISERLAAINVTPAMHTARLEGKR